MRNRKVLYILLKIIYFLMFNTHSVTHVYAEKKLMLSHTPTTLQPHRGIERPTLALFDTAKRERYFYQPIIDMAQASGFTVAYHPITQLIDMPNDSFPLEKYNVAGFVLCPQFLQTMQTSPVSQKILSLINKFSRQAHTTTICMFPPVSLKQRAPLNAFAKLFEQLGISPHNGYRSRQPRDLYTFKALTNRFLQHPLERRPLTYHTTLHLPNKGQSYNLSQAFSGKILPVALLPLKQQRYSQQIKNLFPLAIYYYNPLRKNHLVITSSSICFSSISENFQICPMQKNKRKELELAVHETISNIYHLATQKETTSGLNLQKTLSSPEAVFPNPIDTLIKDVPRKRTKTNDTVAWMEIRPFSPPLPKTPRDKIKKRLRDRQKLADYTLNSELNHLWITINPQMYYSPIGRLKDEKERLKKTFSTFTKKLAQQARKTGRRLPKILIGFEITNNIYKPNMPKSPAQDLYGISYPDIPRPLDKTFWEREVKRPLEIFLQLWKDPSISHGIEISGVVLDLEMYCRKTTESFIATMGLSTETIAQFLRSPLTAPLDPKLFSQHLVSNGLATKYFSFLEGAATKLGTELRRFIHKRIPRAIIGCYAPNISIDWFYKGIYKGLSTRQDPLRLFTFNTEYNSHRPWLEKNGIQSRHLGVLMLSKLKTTKDFSWVDKILQKHDGVWLNRFSRIIEPSHDDWSNLEQTKLSPHDRALFAKYLRNKNQAPHNQAPHQAPHEMPGIPVAAN